MNTPAHLIFGLAAFARAGARGRSAAAFAGSLLPDLSLYLMAGAALAMGHGPRRVFGELYYSDAWQTVFAIDNSIPLWAALLGLGAALRRPVVMVLAGAALLHLGLDFALHHDDARRHFWPLSDWVFRSPVSYWDPRHHGDIVAPLEIGFALALALVLWRRFVGLWPRLGILVLVGAQLLPLVLWAWVFAGGG